MKWKLSTNALLTTVAGTCLLMPHRVGAQQPANVQPTLQTTGGQPSNHDAVSVLNGTIAGVTKAQRDEAAERLLSRHTPEARQALRDALVGPDELSRLAVARALDQDPDADPSFIDPLFQLLESHSRELATAAGRALSGFKADASVLTRLIDRASERRNTGMFTRLAAIRALGTIPDRRAAGTLMLLLVSPDQSPEIHKAAAASLTILTGLDQNGEDAARWQKWWIAQRNKPDAQFRAEINAVQDVRLDRIDAHYQSLVIEVETLLREEYYKTKSLSDRQDLMLTFLNSPQPEVRQIGTRLIGDDVISGAAISAVELQRLRDMIADSDPAVRRAVADAIKKVNDPAALDALINQLKIEPDPTVRAAIASALGPIHDLHAVPTLINLLSDDSMPTAEAAAGALEDLARGPLADDPKRVETAQALKKTILDRTSTTGSGDLRSACIEALAPLQQTEIIQQLIANKLMDPGKEESVEVRRAMVKAVGELNDPHFADTIVNSLDDPAPEVQVEAIDALMKNSRAPEFAERVGSLLNPNPARGQAVSDEAWRFLQVVFPNLSEPQLEQWQHRLRDNPERWLFPLEALRDKQLAGKKLEDLATTDAEIGEANNKLKQYGKAAGSYRAALDIYDQLPLAPNAQATILSLNRAYIQSLLDDSKFTDAVAWATDRIHREPAEQSNLIPVIANKADDLIHNGVHGDLVKAQDLIGEALKIPNLDVNYQARLSDIAADIQKKIDASAETPAPQSPKSAVK